MTWLRVTNAEGQHMCSLSPEHVSRVERVNDHQSTVYTTEGRSVVVGYPVDKMTEVLDALRRGESPEVEPEKPKPKTPRKRAPRRKKTT